MESEKSGKSYFHRIKDGSPNFSKYVQNKKCLNFAQRTKSLATFVLFENALFLGESSDTVCLGVKYVILFPGRPKTTYLCLPFFHLIIFPYMILFCSYA